MSNPQNQNFNQSNPGQKDSSFGQTNPGRKDDESNAKIGKKDESSGTGMKGESACGTSSGSQSGKPSNA